MIKEKDTEILCDLVFSGDVFHAGIDQERTDIVSKTTPFTSRIGPSKNISCRCHG